MGLTAGGPCVGQARRKHPEPAQPCAVVSAHKWYTGPACKNCYERNKTELGKHPKLAKTEDAPAESGGDIPLVCLQVSAARCALPPCYSPTYSARDAPLEKEPLHVAHVCSLAFVPFSTWRTCLVDAWFLPICCLLARVGREHRHVPRQAHVALWCGPRVEFEGWRTWFAS